MNSRATATLMVVAALAANLAFLGLGSVFGYPDVLHEEPAAVLASFRAHQVPVTLGFAVLLGAAALMAPVAIGVRRLTTGRAATWALAAGIGAAAVQVVGLSRWLLAVPTLAWRAADPELAPAAAEAFERINLVLGVVVGETVGYLLTAAWTCLVIGSLVRRPPRWFGWLGLGSAGLIATGVATPLGVPGTDLLNFVGYVAWSGWLIAFAVLLWTGGRSAAPGNRSERLEVSTA